MMSKKPPSSRADSQSNPLNRGEQHAKPQQPLGDPECPVMTAVEAVGQQQQQHAADAAEHMGELQRVQGNTSQEGFDPPLMVGDHPGAEQQGARREGTHAHQGGHKLPGRHHHPPAAGAGGPAVQQLLTCKQQQGTEEGQEVVDAAVDKQEASSLSTGR